MNIKPIKDDEFAIPKPKRTYGFIIARHVNSQKTNMYWNLCIQSIRKFYPNKIVVIDDNSNPEFVKEEIPYFNIEYVQSEFIGRGELLPFYYFYRNRYFDYAIIIHDSVFFRKKVRFDRIKSLVLPLWHFDTQRIENANNSIRLIRQMNYREKLSSLLLDRDKFEVLTKNDNIWMGCFGCQCLINHTFLYQLQAKYNLFSLLKFVRKREDRCCLERIMGILFFLESPIIMKYRAFSLLGSITTYMKWGYTFDKYIDDQQSDKVINVPIIKVWTGR